MQEEKNLTEILSLYTKYNEKQVENAYKTCPKIDVTNIVKSAICSLRNNGEPLEKILKTYKNYKEDQVKLTFNTCPKVDVPPNMKPLICFYRQHKPLENVLKEHPNWKPEQVKSINNNCPKKDLTDKEKAEICTLKEQGKTVSEVKENLKYFKDTQIEAEYIDCVKELPKWTKAEIDQVCNLAKTFGPDHALFDTVYYIYIQKFTKAEVIKKVNECKNAAAPKWSASEEKNVCDLSKSFGPDNALFDTVYNAYILKFTKPEVVKKVNECIAKGDQMNEYNEADEGNWWNKYSELWD